MSHIVIPVEPFDFVIFGVTGDLSRRKLLPALYYRYSNGQIPQESRIIGCARSALDGEAGAQLVRDAILEFVPEKHRDAQTLDEFISRFCYLQMDLSDATHWSALREFFEQKACNAIRVYYLSVGPSLFAGIIEGLKSQQLHQNARLVVEKPLGFDLHSAKKLNTLLASAFDEHHVYRIDHYLGKETVQNLMSLRFANAMFEPLWNARYIDHVQITAAETLGLDGRGAYYDRSGAMRDMVQNHLLQLLCLTAMEAPYDYVADAVRDEKLKVLNSLKPMHDQEALKNTVRGQYSGKQEVPSYLQDVGNEESATECFVAIRAEIKNWRWAGTPFYLRTGKRLAAKTAEIAITFRETPHSVFSDLKTPIKPNALIIRLQPDERINLEFMTKDPGPGGFRLRQSSLDTSSNETENNQFRMPDAYERLLLDVVRGNQTLFMRGDEVEAAWAWIDPIIEAWQNSYDKPELYEAGSQGPAGAVELMARDGRRWRTLS